MFLFIIQWFRLSLAGFFQKNYKLMPVKPTGASLDTLKHVGSVISTPPGGDFKIHGGRFTPMC